MAFELFGGMAGWLSASRSQDAGHWPLAGKFTQLAGEKESNEIDAVGKEEERKRRWIIWISKCLDIRRKEKKKDAEIAFWVELRCSPAEPH